MAATTTNHWKLGLFVVVGIGAIVGVLFWIGAQRFHREAFPAIVFFDESVQGLDVGSPLKFRGVTVGTVSNITIAPDHRHVQVTSDIYVDAVRSLGLSQPDQSSGLPFMPDNLRVQLEAAGITGVQFLEVDFFDPDRYPPPPLPFEPPWNYIPSAPSTLRSLEQAALEFANRLPTLGDQASAALVEGHDTLGSVHRLSDELQGEDGRVNRLITHIDSSADALQSTMRDAQSALRDTQAGATASALRDASNSVSGAAHGVTTGVGDVSDDLRTTLVSLRDTLDSIRALADLLNRDPSVLVRGRRADGAVPVASQ
jgi:paraquat-inducible protein B